MSSSSDTKERAQTWDKESIEKSIRIPLHGAVTHELKSGLRATLLPSLEGISSSLLAASYKLFLPDVWGLLLLGPSTQQRLLWYWRDLPLLLLSTAEGDALFCLFKNFYVFMTALGLHCCVQAFSSGGWQGPLSSRGA